MTEETKKKNPSEISFTETEALNRYVTETGKILPRKFTGLTAKEQRHIKKTIKHARNMLLMK
ncbi:MAG: 30S ribosomal protein S18 [Verrucomicrobia bacterium]|nr:MAG: 30S ribosomal protein S18 [Verrucomicrobiota bacterium]